MPERRPPIGPVLSAVATLLAEWWLGFDVTEADPPAEGGEEPRQLGDIIRRAADGEEA